MTPFEVFTPVTAPLSEAMLSRVEAMKIDFSDVEYLLKNQDHPKEEEVKESIIESYGFLRDLDDDLMRVLRDTRKHRETALVKEICDELRLKGGSINPWKGIH